MTMRQLPIQGSSEASQSHILNKARPRVFIDTDIGDDIDDALALAIALNSPEIDLQGISTVFGDTQQRAQLAAHLLHTSGRTDIPVASGQQQPLQLAQRPSGVSQAAILGQGHQQRCPACTSILHATSISGPELLIETAMKFPGQLTLICLGPLTNVATALKIAPHMFMTIGNVIAMGGSSGVPLPEWNVRSDAEAARTVLAAGLPITMLGLNVTMRCQLKNEEIEQLRQATSPQARLLSQLLAVWQRHRPRGASARPYLHDPLTLAALCRPDLFTFEDITARIFTRGPLKGFMVPRLLNGPIVRAATGIQADAAREWCVHRLLTLTQNPMSEEPGSV